jgi:hypothetical protein
MSAFEADRFNHSRTSPESSLSLLAANDRETDVLVLKDESRTASD